MGKYSSYIRESLRDEANGFFMLANEIAESNRLKRLELKALGVDVDDLGDEA